MPFLNPLLFTIAHRHVGQHTYAQCMLAARTLSMLYCVQVSCEKLAARGCVQGTAWTISRHQHAAW